MKEFIIGFSIFIILIFFPIQWTLAQINHYKLQSVNNIVHLAAQKARIDGYFKEGNLNEMKASLVEALDVSEGDIIIDVTTTPKYRFDTFDEKELITYQITIPINKVIAMNQFFGIEDKENRFIYVLKGQVHSELLAP